MIVHSQRPSSLPVTPALSQPTSNTIASSSRAHAAKKVFPALSLMRLARSIRCSGVTRAELWSAMASINRCTVLASESAIGVSNLSRVFLNVAVSVYLASGVAEIDGAGTVEFEDVEEEAGGDRKSTRLNSSH